MLSLIIGVVGLAPGGATIPAAQPPSSRPPAPAAARAAVAVPRSEFIATMDSEFRKMDADKNNILTRKEIEDYERSMSAIAIDNRRRALFAALDTDRNGTLSSQEFSRLQLPAAPVSAAPVLTQNDLNRDGQVTLVEYRTAKLGNFDRVDTDKDGSASVAEMKAAGVIK